MAITKSLHATSVLWREQKPGEMNDKNDSIKTIGWWFTQRQQTICKHVF
jgi:hypothetical protein